MKAPLDNLPVFIFLLKLQFTFGADQHYEYDAAFDNLVCKSGSRGFEVQVSGKMNCGQICTQKADCASFFYNSTTKTCVGCSSVYFGTTGLEVSPGHVYYRPYVPPQDCLSILEGAPGSLSGIYNITLISGRNISVLCDMDTEGGGWTVFQYRCNGEVDFYRTFQEYTDGFGDVNSEFWLGLQNMHELAPSRLQSEIYLYLHDWNSSSTVQRASTFVVGLYPDFTVTLKNGSEHLISNDGDAFSAKDYGPASWCANNRRSGWWHHSLCSYINANGIYAQSGNDTSNLRAGVVYYPWKGFEPMATTKIMFRRN